jgi:hypothetical protein
VTIVAYTVLTSPGILQHVRHLRRSGYRHDRRLCAGHASAICPGLTCLRAAQPLTSATSAERQRARLTGKPLRQLQFNLAWSFAQFACCSLLPVRSEQ